MTHPLCKNPLQLHILFPSQLPFILRNIRDSIRKALAPDVLPLLGLASARVRGAGAPTNYEVHVKCIRFEKTAG
jgi:hypothetical protein